ncbi:MAG: hypothetical protein JO353_13270 [Phycisphaerae bacterium]|nr:hypothetical protein [Phycisphaerae bacterium]
MLPTGRIDLHAHLLPGVDDGCETLADSIACGKALVAVGYTHACCTPHIWPSLPHNNRKQIPLAVADLQREYSAAGVRLKLIPGGEMNLRPDTIRLKRDDLITYGLAGRSLLIDLWADRLPSYFDSAIEHLQSFDVRIILAHPARMKAVQSNPSLIDRFIEKGLLLQGNLQCFADPPGSPTREISEQTLRRNRYHVLGSDCHGIDTLPIRLEGLENARRIIGDEALNELTVTRPAQIVGV